MRNNISQRKLGALLSYISLFLNTLIQLVYTPFLLRMLGQSEYGLYSLVSSVIGYLTVLDLGFGNAIIVYTIKFRSKNDKENELQMQGMFRIIFWIISLLIGICGLILYLNTERIFGKTMTIEEISKAKTMMLILSFNMFVTFFFHIYSSLIAANEHFIFQKIVAILNMVLRPLIMIPLLFLGFKSISMCIAITSVNLFVIALNYYYCRRKLNIRIQYRGFNISLFKEMFVFSFFIFLGVVIDKINWSVDQFILGAVSGTIAVSIYSVASQLNSLFVNLSSAMSGVLLPKMSLMVTNNATKESLTDEMIKVGRMQLYIIYLAATGFILVGQEFIVLWAGQNYRDAYYVALLLIIPLCIPLIQNLALSICQAMNKHQFRAVATAIMAVINVFISIYLGKKYGAIGCALGTAIALVVCNIIIMNIYYSKVIGLNICRFWKEIMKTVVPLLIPFGFMLLLRKYTYLQGIVAIIVYSIVYVVIYIVIMYQFSMNDYEKELLKKIKSRKYDRNE